MEAKIAVCDDEHQQTEYIKSLVNKWADVKNIKVTVDMFESAENFKSAWSENFALPTEDEWEYICGGGSRTLFRWGDSFDYEMNLYHFNADFLPKDALYFGGTKPVWLIDCLLPI